MTSPAAALIRSPYQDEDSHNVSSSGRSSESTDNFDPYAKIQIGDDDHTTPQMTPVVQPPPAASNEISPAGTPEHPADSPSNLSKSSAKSKDEDINNSSGSKPSAPTENEQEKELDSSSSSGKQMGLPVIALLLHKTSGLKNAINNSFRNDSDKLEAAAYHSSLDEVASVEFSDLQAPEEGFFSGTSKVSPVHDSDPNAPAAYHINTSLPESDSSYGVGGSIVDGLGSTGIPLSPSKSILKKLSSYALPPSPQSPHRR